MFESVPLLSSSSWNEEGVKPPPAVKEKSCGSFGSESWTTMIRPRLRFVKVQVTTSSSDTSMLDGSEPSEQVDEVRSQPLSGISEREYPDPGSATKPRAFEVPLLGFPSSSSAKDVGLN